MDIGMVLPSGIPGVDARVVGEWARRIDAGPYSSVAVADRLGYANQDAMMTLAAAAAVTERVTLTTSILLTPLRPTPLLLKEVGTLVSMAPGRVSLGVGVGARPWDYEVAGIPWSRRGEILDRQLAALDQLRSQHDEQQVGPRLGDLEILIGGASAPACERLVRHADGYVAGGIRNPFFSFDVLTCRQAWAAAGRPGLPRIVGGTWVARSERLDDEASAFLRSYFVTGGPPEMVNAGIVRGADAIRAMITEYRQTGADEVVLFPCTADLAELDWLTEVVASMPDVPRGDPRPVPPDGPPPSAVPGTDGVRVGDGARGPAPATVG